VGLRLFGYVRMRHWIEVASASETSRQATPEDIAEGERLARLASIAGRHSPIATTCLRQSLLLFFLLRRGHMSPEIMIGVRRQGASFDAHAWVRLGGVALGQPDVAHSALPGHLPNRRIV